MQHVVIHKPGGLERLQIESAPDPQPGDGEVVIDVQAAGINYADVLIRMGVYASAKEAIGWPITPGYEVADDSPDGVLAKLAEPPGVGLTTATEPEGPANETGVPCP